MTVTDSYISELISVFSKTTSTNASDIQFANNYVTQQKQQNFPNFVHACTKILANTNIEEVTRFQAGTQAKNCLTSKDENTLASLASKWEQLGQPVKAEIKTLILNTLGTEKRRPSSAAQLVAAIAYFELHKNQWEELLPGLASNVTKNEASDIAMARQESSLEAIGYICADIEQEHVVRFTSHVLTAIVHGMKTGATSHIKLAATNAMLNSLEFINTNFEQASERNYIMQVVCEASTDNDTRIKVASLQCLVKIVSLYYHVMESYMSAALFPITVESMKNPEDGVCLQGIEFWSNVCDEEYDLAYEAQEAWNKGQPPAKQSFHYAKGALPHLTPILCETLTRQDEHDCEDDWTPGKAAGVCLQLLSQITEDEILDKILPFVQEKISSPDWKYRDAAVVALGSILDGPTPSKLESLLLPAIGTIVNLFNDSSVAVRDSTAWCIGKICETVPTLTLNDQIFEPLLKALVDGLSHPPRVASNVCWTIKSLVEAVYNSAENINEDTDNVVTYKLSPYFQHIIKKLLETTNRSDGNESNLRASAYESIMEMIKNSPDDQYQCVVETTQEIMKRIQHLLGMSESSMSAQDRSQYADLQSLLCATLQSVLRKIKPEHIGSMSDQMMQSLLTLVQNSQNYQDKDQNDDDEGPDYGAVHSDALLAIGTLTEVVKSDFDKYMCVFKPMLIKALENYEEPSVCSAAVGVIGDISRALDGNFNNYVEEFMHYLLKALMAPEQDQSVRPHILGVFGDVCLAIKGEFSKYLGTVMQTLNQASQINIDRNDYDQVDYLNEIYESMISSTLGILHGLAATDKNNVYQLNPHLEFVFNLIKKIAVDEDKTASVISETVGLIGDLIKALVTENQTHPDVKNIAIAMSRYCQEEPIQNMLKEARNSKTTKTKQIGVWASREVRKLKQLVEPANTNFAGNQGFTTSVAS